MQVDVFIVAYTVTALVSRGNLSCTDRIIATYIRLQYTKNVMSLL